MSTDKYSHSALHHKVARSAGVIAVGTLCSRALGFARDMVIARLFGIYIWAQAFVIAFRIPNLLRDLLAEGAANAAIVPVFSEYAARHSKEEFWELANVVLNLLLIILSAVTILGILFSPFIVRLIAPGFIASAEKLEATIRLNRIIFPYILLIGLAAYATALLNSLKHFAIPAFAPCLLNIAIITFALIFGEGIRGLALGVLVGGLLQLLVQVPPLLKKGFYWRFPLRLKHPAAALIAKLMAPRVLSTSIYQLNNFVDSVFGSLAWVVGDGGVAVLYFSYRLIQFPIGVFSNSISQAILPTFSTQALEESREGLKESLSWALRLVFLVMLPATVIYMSLGLPLVRLLFGGGKFDLRSSLLTAEALFFYSIGLCAYAASKILQSCFFALKDTVTPAKVAFVALLLNIVLSAALMFPLKIGGLALATSLSGISSFFILFFTLRRKINAFQELRISCAFLRILCASLCMGLVCVLVNKALNLYWAIFAAPLSYIGFCFVFRVTELRGFWGLFRSPGSGL